MKPEIKIERDGMDLKISYELGGQLDKDQDGKSSVKVSNKSELVVSGLELVDELMKSAPILEKIKEKLGAG